MRLIDADSIQEELAVLILYLAGTPEGECVDYAHNLIDAQPTIDAVPVIRCKDCKWYEYDEKLHCGLPHGIRLKDDYCSDAERKEE